MKKNLSIILLFVFLAIPSFAEEFNITTMQNRIHTGMSQPEVISCLGAPNVVTKNSGGCETWVYDKSSQSTTESYNKGWFWLLLVGRRKGYQKTETSQKSLTVVLNFNENSCLETFSYKASSF